MLSAKFRKNFEESWARNHCMCSRNVSGYTANVDIFEKERKKKNIKFDEWAIKVIILYLEVKK